MYPNVDSNICPCLITSTPPLASPSRPSSMMTARLLTLQGCLQLRTLMHCITSLNESQLGNYYLGWRVESIKLADQLLVTLMKLCLNPKHIDLAQWFNTSETSVTNITLTWITALHQLLHQQIMMKKGIPSTKKNQACLSCFSSFSGCRIIIDCTEVMCAIPTAMDQRSATFSHDKHCNTFKALVEVALNGVIT